MNRDGPGKENGCSCVVVVVVVVVVLHASYKSNSGCLCPVTVFCSARTIYCGLQFSMPTLKCHRGCCWGTPGVFLCICRGSVALIQSFPILLGSLNGALFQNISHINCKEFQCFTVHFSIQ